MPVTQKKDTFLLNPKDKQRFLCMLSRALQNTGCVTHHADGVADLLIFKTAIESCQTKPTVLVGDDTDLLVLCVIMLLTIATASIFDQSQKQAQKYTASGM